MTRDTLWLPPPPPRVYTTHDAAGRPHVCPAALRLATDAAFAARVEAGRRWRESMAARVCEESAEKLRVSGDSTNERG